jgi:hypothetical protein
MIIFPIRNVFHLEGDAPLEPNSGRIIYSGLYLCCLLLFFSFLTFYFYFFSKKPHPGTSRKGLQGTFWAQEIILLRLNAAEEN